MNTEQVIQYMKRLPGVAGAFVAGASGEILGAEVPAIFDQVALDAMAMDGTNAIETLRAEMPSCHELRIDTGLMTVLIKDLKGSLLFTLVDQPEEASSVRIALNVVSKRYAPENDSPAAAPEKDSGGSVFSLGGRKKEKPSTPDKPSSGGSIWG